MVCDILQYLTICSLQISPQFLSCFNDHAGTCTKLLTVVCRSKIKNTFKLYKIPFHILIPYKSILPYTVSYYNISTVMKLTK